MAILIERSITPVYANAMNVDTDANGVVDGFISSVDNGITATLSLNNSAQKIDMTASTAVGEAKVKTDSYKTVSANTAYSLQVLTRGSITAGTPILQVKIEWYDSTYTLLSTSVATDTSITTYWKMIRFENITSPATAAYAHIVLAIKAQAAGDTGAVWFRNVKLVQSTICDTFATTTRAADSAYIDIAPLTGEWALSGAFALPYASTAVLPMPSQFATILQLKDSGNQYALQYDGANKKFILRKTISGNDTIVSTATVSFEAYRIHKFVISQGNNGMHIFIRKNNSTSIEAHNTDIALITPAQFYLGGSDTNYNANALVESVTLYRNKAITTLAEADDIFDNMNAEMVINGGFDNGSTGWTLAGGNVWENGMLKKVSTNASGVTTMGSWQNIKVLPNNTYKIQARLIGYVDINNRPRLEIKTMDMFLVSTGIQYAHLFPTAYDQICETTITTSSNAYYISLHSMSTGSGTFYWDDISTQLIN